MAFVKRLLTNEIPCVPYPPVIIKKQAGINPVRTLYKYRIAPWPCRILRSYDIIISARLTALGNKGIDNIKCPFMISYRRSPESQRCFTILVIQLLRTVNQMPYLFPMYQISAVKYRQPREIYKGGGHHIVIFSNAANGRIRIKAG